MVRKMIISVLVAGLLAAALPWKTYALGLGDITVKSGLNQALEAEIALYAVQGIPLEAINVKLASNEAFAQAGIDRALVLSKLRFRPLRGEMGKPFVKISSRSPIQAPYLNFLISVTWPQGHSLREYAILLNPPFPRKSASPPLDVATPDTIEVSQATLAKSIAPTKGVAMKGAADSSTRKAPPSSYGPIQPGDSLWLIAQRVRSDPSITTQQMMLALQRNNPDIFLYNNINGLMEGKTLQVPSKEEVLKLSPEEAVQQVQRQRQAWEMRREQGTAQKNPVSSTGIGSNTGAAAQETLQSGGIGEKITRQAAQQQALSPEETLPEVLTKQSPLAPKASEVQPLEKEDSGARLQATTWQRSSMDNSEGTAVHELTVAATEKVASSATAESVAALRRAISLEPPSTATIETKPPQEGNDAGGFMARKNLLWLAGGSLLLLVLTVFWLRKRRSVAAQSEPEDVLEAPGEELESTAAGFYQEKQTLGDDDFFGVEVGTQDKAEQAWGNFGDVSPGVETSSAHAAPVSQDKADEILPQAEGETEAIPVGNTAILTGLDPEQNFKTTPDDAMDSAVRDLLLDHEEGAVILDEEETLSPAPAKERMAEPPQVDEKEEGLDFDLGDYSFPAAAENCPEDNLVYDSSDSERIMEFTREGVSDEDEAAPLENRGWPQEDLSNSEKLDLAKTYIDLGSSKEARPVLEEVVATGDEAQRNTAQALLTKLAG